MLKLKEGNCNDAKKLTDIAISSKAYWGYSNDFIEKCKADLTIDEEYINRHYVYVLENENKMIGFFSFIRQPYDQLDFLYITPNQIGKGYGELIWEFVTDKALDIGIKSFTIDSDPHAKGYYEKMGAIQISEVSSSVFKDRKLPLLKYVL